MDRVISKAEAVIKWISYGSLCCLMLITTADAGMRYIFNAPILGAYELSKEFFMPGLVYLALSYTFNKGAHVRITILTDHLPNVVNRIMMMIFDVLAAVFFGLICYSTFLRTVTTYQLNEYSSSPLGYLIWPSFALVVIGSLFITLRLIQSFVTGKHPKSQTF